MQDREIVHGGPVPVYQQVASILRELITSGELTRDQALPSESYLVQQYGISRASARHAVAVLRDEGLVYTIPQRGTFVGSGPPTE
jgi:DNA-binding GntR family transcriptional regulator